MTWSVQGTKAVDEFIGSDLDDSAEIQGEELVAHAIMQRSSYNVHVYVKIPKAALLQLLANAGWVPK